MLYTEVYFFLHAQLLDVNKWLGKLKRTRQFLVSHKYCFKSTTLYLNCSCMKWTHIKSYLNH